MKISEGSEEHRHEWLPTFEEFKDVKDGRRGQITKAKERVELAVSDIQSVQSASY